MIWQIREEQSGNFENAALVPLVRELQQRFKGVDLLAVSAEAMTYISSVVRTMLSRRPERLDYMRCLTDACRSEVLGPIDIFTLNHDTLIEGELHRAGIQYTDGFAIETDSCDYWDRSAFESPEHPVRLGKLHGSLDWFAFHPDPQNPRRQMFGRPANLDPWHTTNFAGQLQWPDGGTAAVLVGAHNKLLEYTGRIFNDLFCAFRSALSSADRLIVSGYGFRDKGVNQSIVEWLHESVERRLLLIHRDPLNVEGHARRAIRREFRTAGGQIVRIKKWFEEASVADLEIPQTVGDIE